MKNKKKRRRRRRNVHLVQSLIHECMGNMSRRQWEKLITSFRVILQVCLRSGPSLLKCWCGLSRMMKTISAGILFGAWSPSRWKVILVPDFQPGFTLIVSTFSSFFAVPSFATTRLDIFIRLVTPWNINLLAWEHCEAHSTFFCL